MSLESHFHHTAIIQRVTNTAEDPLGGPGTVTTATVYSGPCRLVEKSERVLSTDRAERVVVTRFLLLLPPGAAVQERDSVLSVTADGVVYLSTWRIGQLLTRRKEAAHHLTAELERVS